MVKVILAICMGPSAQQHDDKLLEKFNATASAGHSWTHQSYLCEGLPLVWGEGGVWIPNFIYCVNPIARIFDGLEP